MHPTGRDRDRFRTIEDRSIEKLARAKELIARESGKETDGAARRRSPTADPKESTDRVAAVAHGFSRGLGLYDSTMIVAGSMIGSAIFIVAADMSRQLGSSGWPFALVDHRGSAHGHSRAFLR